jgi:uncharacterized membrane protein YfcA
VELAIICIVALAASALTLLSGFGLGALLTPVFALFFPIEAAVAMTAIVHLANNVFKLGLVGRSVAWSIVLRFGLPAAVAAFAGAGLLVYVTDLAPIATYEAFSHPREIAPVKLVIGLLIIVFALLELSPGFAALAIPAQYLPWGGALSGFFGGLSGNQGAFRTAFLIKAGLAKDAFIATGVACAVIVDLVRLIVYAAATFGAHFEALPAGAEGVVGAAMLSAFLGAYLGARIMKKLTLRAVQIVVAIFMAAVGLGLAAGFV